MGLFDRVRGSYLVFTDLDSVMAVLTENVQCRATCYFGWLDS